MLKGCSGNACGVVLLEKSIKGIKLSTTNNLASACFLFVALVCIFVADVCIRLVFVMLLGKLLMVLVCCFFCFRLIMMKACACYCSLSLISLIFTLSTNQKP